MTFLDTYPQLFTLYRGAAGKQVTAPTSAGTAPRSGFHASRSVRSARVPASAAASAGPHSSGSAQLEASRWASVGWVASAAASAVPPASPSRFHSMERRSRRRLAARPARRAAAPVGARRFQEMSRSSRAASPPAAAVSICAPERVFTEWTVGGWTRAMTGLYSFHLVKIVTLEQINNNRLLVCGLHREIKRYSDRW